jgi:LacI family transcriptional regulator
VSQRPTIAEIASEAGVSLPTVSRVLNKRPDVAPETRQRVQEVLEARGYLKKPNTNVPNIPALKLVDLIIAGWLDSEFYGEMVRGMEEVLVPAGVRLVLSTMHRNQQFVQNWHDQLAQYAPHGAIFLTADDCLAFDTLSKLSIPFLVIDDNVPMELDIPSIGANNWRSGLLATEHLLSLGHRQIAMITGWPSHRDTKGRIAGYRTALETAGLHVDPSYLLDSDYSPEQGYIQTHALLDRPNPPTALIAACDAQALGVYRALYERGLRIPDDISVIGFDDIPTAQWMAPPLTTIRQPLREIGRVAAERLLYMMAGKTLETLRFELASSLLVRSSCTQPSS